MCIFKCYTSDVLILILKIVIAIILLQTLYYKFTGHPESREIFKQVNLFNISESYGRLSIGILELLFTVCLFISNLMILGLIGIITLMLGAIYFHIARIGFKKKNYYLAVSAGIVVIFSIIILVNV